MRQLQPAVSSLAWIAARPCSSDAYRSPPLLDTPVSTAVGASIVRTHGCVLSLQGSRAVNRGSATQPGEDREHPSMFVRCLVQVEFVHDPGDVALNGFEVDDQ